MKTCAFMYFLHLVPISPPPPPPPPVHHGKGSILKVKAQNFKREGEEGSFLNEILYVVVGTAQ